MFDINALLRAKGLPPISAKSAKSHADIANEALSTGEWASGKVAGGTVYKMMRFPYSLVVSEHPWFGITASYKRVGSDPVAFATYIEGCESVEAAKAAVIAAVEALS